MSNLLSHHVMQIIKPHKTNGKTKQQLTKERATT
jgi:hypothetical protein